MTTLAAPTATLQTPSLFEPLRAALRTAGRRFTNHRRPAATAAGAAAPEPKTSLPDTVAEVLGRYVGDSGPCCSGSGR